jgi:hypothetical protein
MKKHAKDKYISVRKAVVNNFRLKENVKIMKIINAPK